MATLTVGSAISVSSEYFWFSSEDRILGYPTNPATVTGTLDTFKIFIGGYMHDFRVGILRGSGTSWKCVSAASLGSLITGTTYALRTYTGLSLSVQKNDIIAISTYYTPPYGGVWLNGLGVASGGTPLLTRIALLEVSSNSYSYSTTSAYSAYMQGVGIRIGPEDLKTVNGLALTSVKTINNLQLTNIDNLTGL